jgi:hypothetical protein
MINVVVVEPNKIPYVKEIKGDLDSCQKIVGGLIQCVTLEGGSTLICNDEGKLINLPPNRILYDDIICGNFFITKADFLTGEFCSLSDNEIAKIILYFSPIIIS